MGKRFDQIGNAHRKFIEAQHMFFVATAAPDGRVNVSPKGMDALRVLGPNRILWRNITGSGNETAGHLLESDRMTLMWCAFEGAPLILRCFGTARSIHASDPDWSELSANFPPHRSARQIFDMNVDLVQNSCGYVVPLMTYEGERDIMDNWVAAKSDQEIRDYWAERNAATIDGRPTGIPT
ncbi:pyridoxamine 5'-phosphate oxidase family protein [Nioella aestuarii]|uniref:pyridoxamine 5'-phosphate oxidase family protein n=1 Tax=Nioella aestuarii TaxID=1662864 RepID=UPI003D7FEAF6